MSTIVGYGISDFGATVGKVISVYPLPNSHVPPFVSSQRFGTNSAARCFHGIMGISSASLNALGGFIRT